MAKISKAKLARNEALAKDILKFLQDNDLWQDTTIFFNGKAFATSNYDEANLQYRYSGEPFVLTLDPNEYFEYAAKEDHIVSMTFEGPLYEILNYGVANGLHEQFDAIFAKHGVYYELGNQWNLSCYKK